MSEPLSKSELALISLALDNYGDRLSNDGANEVDTEWKQVLDRDLRNLIASENDCKPSDINGYNWMVVEYLRARCAALTIAPSAPPVSEGATDQQEKTEDRK